MNVVMLGGRLLDDPAVVELPDGKKTTFTIVVEDMVRGEKESFRVFCEAYSTGGDLIRRDFRKGDPIYVQGCLRDDSVEDGDEILEGLKLYIKHFNYPLGRREKPRNVAQ